jgi:hypothetical protein
MKQPGVYCNCMRIGSSDSDSLLQPARSVRSKLEQPRRSALPARVSVSRPGVTMRKVCEVLMVIAAAGLAAAVALIDIPTHSAVPGTVVAGGELFAAPPPTSASTLPLLPPLLFPPGAPTPVPIKAPTTPALPHPLGVQSTRNAAAAASPAIGMLVTPSVGHVPTSATKPKPSASTKPTPPPTLKQAKPPPTKSKPHASRKPKPPPTKSKPPHTSKKPKDERKSDSSGKVTSAASSPRSIASRG